MTECPALPRLHYDHQSVDEQPMWTLLPTIMEVLVCMCYHLTHNVLLRILLQKFKWLEYLGMYLYTLFGNVHHSYSIVSQFSDIYRLVTVERLSALLWCHICAMCATHIALHRLLWRLHVYLLPTCCCFAVVVVWQMVEPNRLIGDGWYCNSLMIFWRCILTCMTSTSALG